MPVSCKRRSAKTRDKGSRSAASEASRSIGAQLGASRFSKGRLPGKSWSLRGLCLFPGSLRSRPETCDRSGSGPRCLQGVHLNFLSVGQNGASCSTFAVATAPSAPLRRQSSGSLSRSTSRINLMAFNGTHSAQFQCCPCRLSARGSREASKV